MNPWNNGYTTDIDYTAGFYRDLTPGIIRTALLLHGLDLPPRAAGEPLRYLELGYGQGLSLNIHAAAVPGEFWGTDFNPNHTLHAESLCQQAALQTKLLNLSFAELAQSRDIPAFDLIVLHGIWSWISDENRGHILHIIAQHLKMGGACMVSYNALPGWASMMPMRDIMAMHASICGTKAQNPLEKIYNAFSFARTLSTTDAAYFAVNTQARNMLEALKHEPAAYVAHEYFNSNWRPFYFADVANALEIPKASYVTSTRFLQTLNSICLPPEGLELFTQSPKALWQESLRDYYLNQTFRADIFVKGQRRLSPALHNKRLQALAFVLTSPVADIPLSAQGPRGQIQLKEDIYAPLLLELARNAYQPKTLARLQTSPSLAQLGPELLQEAITVLLGTGHIHPAQKEGDIAAARAACWRCNAALLEQAVHSATSNVLASPVLGGGLYLSAFEQLFLSAWHNGATEHADWASYALHCLTERGEQLLDSNGTALGPEQALEALTALAQSFKNERLSLLEAMQVLPPATST